MKYAYLETNHPTRTHVALDSSLQMLQHWTIMKPYILIHPFSPSEVYVELVILTSSLYSS